MDEHRDGLELESLAYAHRADQQLLAEVRRGTPESMHAALLRARAAHEGLTSSLALEEEQ